MGEWVNVSLSGSVSSTRFPLSLSFKLLYLSTDHGVVQAK